jgi:hypothetical protein
MNCRCEYRNGVERESRYTGLPIKTHDYSIRLDRDGMKVDDVKARY